MAKKRKRAELTPQRVGKKMRGLLEPRREHADAIACGDTLAEPRRRVPRTEHAQGSFGTSGERSQKTVRLSHVEPAKADWILKDEGGGGGQQQDALLPRPGQRPR